MKYEFSPAPEHALIDILIGVADRGGVENVINITGAYLIRHGMRVRVTQLVWEHHPWVDESIEFNYLSDQRDGWDLGGFAQAYEGFLKTHDKPDLILATNWPYMSLIARQAIDRAGIDCLIGSWLHSSVDRYAANGFGGMDALKYSDFHLAINSSIAKDIFLNYPDAVVYRVNNPVNTKRLFFAESRSVLRRLVFVGRISEEKNLPLVLNALELAPSEWELAVYGEGEHDERQELEKYCQSREQLAGRVKFYGWVYDLWEREKDAYGLVMSSLYEGFPLTAIEALKCGMPVISTPVDGVIELIRPGENGFVYPMGDAEALAKILRFISDDKLPSISSARCRDSVSRYDPESALWDMYCKLSAAVRGRVLLPLKYALDKASDRLFATEKAPDVN